MHNNLLTSPLFGAHLECFQVFTILNNAMMQPIMVSLGYVPRSGSGIDVSWVMFNTFLKLLNQFLLVLVKW